MIKMVCVLMPISEDFEVDLKELSNVFGKKFYHIPIDDEFSILSSETIEINREHYFYSAMNIFNDIQSPKDIQEFDLNNVKFEILEKKKGAGKFKLTFEENVFEVTVPNRDLIFITEDSVDNGDVEC